MTRTTLLISIPLLLAVLAIAMVANTEQPRAEFTFCNGADVPSLDPALANNSAAVRVVGGLFENLCSLDPENSMPLPGVAENIRRNTSGEWDCVSADGTTYRFHIRRNAKWSDGSNLTAHDFVYSYRRVLDPLTAAPAPYLLTDYVVGAEKYHSQRRLTSGDAVEIELPLAEGESSNRRGKIVLGQLTSPIQDGVFEAEVDGERRLFALLQAAPNAADSDANATAGDNNNPKPQPCRQVLYDFREVGITAVDDDTLVIRLNKPQASFLQILGNIKLAPVQQQNVEAHAGSEWARPENLVCNGPFVVEQRRLRDRIRLRKNPHYWDGANVACETIDALTVESSITMLNLFESGQADWIPSVPTPLIDELRQHRSKSLRMAPAFSTYFYVFNVRQPPFNNRQVRLSFCQSVRRREIIETVLRGGQEPARSFVPPGVSGYPTVPCPSEDALAAAGLYNQMPAPWRNLLTLESNDGSSAARRLAILCTAGETHRKIAEMVQAQWRETLRLGVEIQSRDFAALRETVRREEFDIVQISWTGEVSDPAEFLQMFVSASPFNDSGWSNEEYDRLFAAAGETSDPNQRLELLAQAEAILLDDAVFIPLYHRVSTHLVRPEVGGFYSNANDLHPLKSIHPPSQAP